MGNFTGGNATGGAGGAGVGGAGAGGFQYTTSGSPIEATPEEKATVTLRYAIAQPPADVERALPRAAKAGCAAANGALRFETGTKVRGEVRPQADGALVIVMHVAMAAVDLDESSVASATAAFRAAFEAKLRAAGVEALSA